MANSYIFTRGGLSVIVANKPYNVESTHPNYQNIIDALKETRFDEIPDLVNMAKAIDTYVKASDSTYGRITVNTEAGVVYFNGEPIRNTLVDQILHMMRDSFDIKPFCLFLDNLMNNPSKKAVDQAYTWIERNGMTISEDGYLLAWKRVQHNWTSFHDSKTLHTVGEYVEMPRNACDDRSEITCSTGLHFCSQSYLPQYCSGQGKVLLLKINPADIVSIPTDYNFSKGRACKYLVLEELKDDAREDIEVKDVTPQPVLAEAADVNQSRDFKEGYVKGYKDGRGKQRRTYKLEDLIEGDLDEVRGYIDGYADGRAKKPKLY